MPINYVVGGCCRNQNNSPESSFYRFPSDSSCQRYGGSNLWTPRSDFVRTKTSRVCSAHFVNGDFKPSNSLLKRKFGIGGTRLRLLLYPHVHVRVHVYMYVHTCTRVHTNSGVHAHVHVHNVRCKMGLYCTGACGLFSRATVTPACVGLRAERASR